MVHRHPRCKTLLQKCNGAGPDDCNPALADHKPIHILVLFQLLPPEPSNQWLQNGNYLAQVCKELEQNKGHGLAVVLKDSL
ncbi:uncharacterized [Tachysurus ichikawai]